MAEMNFRMSQLRELMLSGILRFDYESLLERHYKKWIAPGDTVIDIGAHKGRHLAEFIRCVGPSGRVFGFEPLPFQFSHLQKTFRERNVHLENVALSDKSGVSTFTFAQGCPEESGLRPRIYNVPQAADPTEINVRTAMLDEFIDEFWSINFIKMDIEGGEIDCLHGSSEILHKFRPLVSVEYGFQSYSVYGNTSSTLYELAKSHDYILYDIFLNSLADKSVWDTAVDSIYYDYFMVPKEREEEFLTKMAIQT